MVKEVEEVGMSSSGRVDLEISSLSTSGSTPEMEQ